jgi:hypothetical protein
LTNPLDASILYLSTHHTGAAIDQLILAVVEGARVIVAIVILGAFASALKDSFKHQ